MPGMTSGSTDRALAAAFRAALLAQGTVAFLIFVLLAIAWVASRETVLARDRATLIRSRTIRAAEPAARRLLRLGFGALWLFDGLLQAQPAMPGGLPSRVLAPAAGGSPGWVLQLAGWAGRAWAGQPVQVAAATVWIQLGIGIWLLSAARGRWSRLAGIAGACWALVVWIFGEAFGGIFAPGLSWLTGAPGAAVFYAVAGTLIALPFRSWQQLSLGRLLLRGEALLLLGFAVLQAWPGSGSWPGGANGRPGMLASGGRAMAGPRQPAFLDDLVSGFARFAAGHGIAVNLAAVLVLAAAGGGLLTGRLALTRPAVIAMIGFCLADWVIVQDLGFLGGLGTDPNSMVPQAILLAAGLAAISASPAPAPSRAPAPAPDGRAGASGRSALAGLGLALGTASTSAVLVLWAMALVILGAAPLALAAVGRLG
jgi:hypothetical protein